MNTINQPLALSGAGYDIIIDPAAAQMKAEALAAAAGVARVTNLEESGVASFHLRGLAKIRIDVEKCRKTVKEPVLAIGKRIDQAAKEFLAEIEAEEKRLDGMIGAHAQEVARLKAAREAEERRIAEEARRAREEAERAAAAAENSRKMADVIAARQAEQERQRAAQASLAAANDTAAARVADGVRFVWDFEVLDAHRLAANHPDLVRIEVKRAEMLAAIKDAAESGACMEEAAWEEVGIRPFKKTVVSTR